MVIMAAGYKSIVIFLSVLCANVRAHGLVEHAVTTPSGLIVGSTAIETWSGISMYSYRGIRYAQPPVGDLRFKPPVPIQSWSDELDATKNGNACLQPGGNSSGPASEDCLFLNVYTPKARKNLPVIVYFHAGGFFFGSARSDELGPEYLLDHQMVLVTANYRLGVLGFLSTGDDSAQGNYGFKDQVTVLRWVRKNIAAFGGDPNKVTIAGYSVGATSVLLHMLSPMSKGLFHRAIAMSGGLTSGWVVQKNPLKLANLLGELTGCKHKDSTIALINCLRQLPGQQLADSYVKLREWGHDPGILFGAVIEGQTSNGEKFLTGMPKYLIETGKFTKVPVVMGINRDEFKARAQAIMRNDTLRNDLNVRFDELAPIIFYYERGTQKSKTFSQLLRHYYLNNDLIQKGSEGISQLYSDATIIVGVEQTARLLAKYSKKPVYFYFTDYKGRNSYSFGDNSSQSVVHMDELFYLLTQNRKKFLMYTPEDPEAEMVKTFTSIWFNFANTGIPTPNGIEFEWPALTSDSLQYLNISTSISKYPDLPYKERTDIWEQMFPVKN